MAGNWQQYPPNQIGYPDTGGYPNQQGYPQAGYGANIPFQHPGYGPQYPQPYAAQPGQYGYGPQGPAYGQVAPSPAQYLHPGQYPPQSQPFPNQMPQHGQQPPINTCYNCGNPDHWAQNCLEPKREVPHGQQIENLARPFKRFRPNYIPPVITKYPVPPHLAQQQPTPPSYGPSPSWSHQQSSGSPPPQTAVPTPQWLGQHPQEPPQQPQQQSPPQHPRHPSQQHPQQQWGPSQRSPGEISTFSPQAPLHHPNPSGQSGPARAQGLWTPPYGSDPQGPTKSAAPSEQEKPETASTAMSRGPSNISTDQSVSMESDSDSEPDPEDFLLLDIPDLPNLLSHPKAKRPQLVEKALPPISDSDEAIEYIVPGTGMKQTVTSKYHKANATEGLSFNVKDSKDFATLEDDPVFRASTGLSWELEREESSAPNPDPESPVVTIEVSFKSERAMTASREAPPPQEWLDDIEASPTDLERLIRKHYSDVKPSPKAYSRDAPPPPPPPTSPPRGHRRQSNYSATSPPRRQFSNGNDRSPTSERYSRKRRHDDDEPTRLDGQRQRDDSTPKTRRNAPKVADVYSRRW